MTADKKPIIYWHSQPTDRESLVFVAAAMEEFCAGVRQAVHSDIQTERVSPRVQTSIENCLADASLSTHENPISILELNIDFAMEPEYGGCAFRIIIYCPEADHIQDLARRQMEIGHDPWGVTSNRKAFVFYPSVKQLIWHEALHTIGADECYDPKAPRERYPQCTDDCCKCLMQFEPTSGNCGDGFPICSRVIGEARIGLAPDAQSAKET